MIIFRKKNLVLLVSLTILGGACVQTQAAEVSSSTKHEAKNIELVSTQNKQDKQVKQASLAASSSNTVSASYQYQSANVDARTGSLSMSIPLGQLSLLDYAQGFKLSANYSRTAVPDSAYKLANHFALGLPVYDIQNKVIISASGQKLVLAGVLNKGSGYTLQKFKYHPLKDVAFYFNTTSGQAQIAGSYLQYADHREYFNAKGLIDKIEYNTGATITFAYNESLDGTVYRLVVSAWIPDNTGQLQNTGAIKVKASSSTIETYSMIADNQNFVATLTLSSGDVSKVNYDKDQFGDLYSSSLLYNASGLLSSIKNSIGSSVSYDYGSIQAKLTSGQNIKIPVVTKITALSAPSSEGQESNTIEYAYGANFNQNGVYTDNNYTGYPKYALNTDTQAADSLYDNNANGYAYTTQTKSISSDGITDIINKRTYNHKGMLIESQSMTNTGVILDKTQYGYCDTAIYGASQDCPDLRNNATTSQLPKFVQITSYGKNMDGSTSAVKMETTEQKYNDAGKVVYSKSANGTTSTIQYFGDIDGEALPPVYIESVDNKTVDGYESKTTNSMNMFHIVIKDGQVEHDLSMPAVTESINLYKSPTQTEYTPLMQSTTNWATGGVQVKNGTPLSSGLPVSSTTTPLTYDATDSAKLRQTYVNQSLEDDYLYDFLVKDQLYLKAVLNNQMSPNIATVNVMSALTGASLWTVSGDATLLIKDGHINENIVTANGGINWAALTDGIKTNRLNLSNMSFDHLGRVVTSTTYRYDAGVIKPFDTHFYYGMDNGYRWTLSEDVLHNMVASIYDSSGQLLSTYDNSNGQDGGLITSTLPSQITSSWINETLRLTLKNTYNRAGLITNKISLSNKAGTYHSAGVSDGYLVSTDYAYDNRHRLIDTTTSTIENSSKGGETKVEQHSYDIYFDKAPSDINNSENKGYTMTFSAVKLASGDYQINSNINVSETDYTPDSPDTDKVVAQYVIPKPTSLTFQVGGAREAAHQLLLQINDGMCHKVNGLCTTTGYYNKTEFVYNGRGLYQTISSPITTTIKLNGDSIAHPQSVQIITENDADPSLNKGVVKQFAINTASFKQQSSEDKTLLAERVVYMDPLSGNESCTAIGLNNDACVSK